MATPNDSDTRTDRSQADAIRSAVETANAEDESKQDTKVDDQNSDDDDEGDDESDEDEDDSADDDDAEGDDESDDADDSEDDKDSDKSKTDDKASSADFAFPQFAGDGKQETYLKNLEKGYKESSAEGIRLNTQLTQKTRQIDAIMAAAQKDEKFATQLHNLLKGVEGSGSDGKTPEGAPGIPSAARDPFLVNAETDWEKKSTEEAEAFATANPEVMSDPKINADVKYWMNHLAAAIYQKEKRVPTSGELMKAAYRQLGLEDKSVEAEDKPSKSKVGGALKRTAAPTRPQGSKKKASTGNEFSDMTLDFASKMNLSSDKLTKYGRK